MFYPLFQAPFTDVGQGPPSFPVPFERVGETFSAVAAVTIHDDGEVLEGGGREGGRGGKGVVGSSSKIGGSGGGAGFGGLCY